MAEPNTRARPHPRQPIVVAHRGASFDAPENTIAAFDLALSQGADALELDVRSTADGQLIVWHDDSLERTARLAGTVHAGVVAEMTFDQIALCDTGKWFNERFPGRASRAFVAQCPLTLDDVLRRYGERTSLFIELKESERHPSMATRVLELLEEHEQIDHPHRLLSTDAASLIGIRCARPRAMLVQVLPHRGAWQLRLDEIAQYADAISPLRSCVGANMIAAARRQNLDVFPHTVNDPSEAARLIDQGVTGLITDVPATLLDAHLKRQRPGRRPVGV